MYIQEEMEARGWNRDDLATAMIRHDGDNWGVTRLALDLYFEAGPNEPRMEIGDHTAAQLAHAFGVSPDLFLNLCRSWREWKKAKP